MSPLRLIETMRVEKGAVALLTRHLARLTASAARLGHRLELAEAQRAVEQAAAACETASRLRLTLGAAGDLEVSAAPLGEERWATAAIAPWPLHEAGGPLCRHKTTRRAHYERAFAWARAAGADEAILLSPAGEVVEGSRSTVWVRDGASLVTPPLSAGGLPGVQRAHILDAEGRAREGRLWPADLHASPQVYLSNAVRGLVPVRLLSPTRSASP